MPRSYTAEVREELLELLVQGNTLTDVCKRDGMPTVRTVTEWLAEDKQFLEIDSDPENPTYEADGEGFAARLHRAMQTQTLLDMAEARFVVRDTKDDVIDGRSNPVAVARAKLTAEFTLKVAERTLAKFAPRQKLLTEDEQGDRPLGIAVPLKEPSDVE